MISLLTIYILYPDVFKILFFLSKKHIQIYTK